MIGPFVVSVLMLGSLTGPCDAQAPALHPTRSQLYRALLTGKVLDPDRALVHLAIDNLGHEGTVLTSRIEGGNSQSAIWRQMIFRYPRTRKRKHGVQ
jgi:sugar (pentulose or hexulose) kinase